MKKGLFACVILALTTNVNAEQEMETQPYIIQFKNKYLKRTTDAKSKLNQSINIKYKKTFNRVASGVAVDLTEKQYEKLLKLPFIKRIEIDQQESITSETNWGLDRIDQTDLPLDGSYNLTYDGNGANIYIIDTGINGDHEDFGGRVSTEITFASGDLADCQGHGTHVASIAAGSMYGVATEATIHSIKISDDCGGTASTSNIIAAYDWVAENALPNAVINFSFTFSSSLASDIMDELIEAGVVVVSSAGNNGIDACSASGSVNKANSALLVGNITKTDTLSSTSNYGSCVDLFAPGNNITAAAYDSDTGTISKSGTSMSSPFVAGVAAAFRAQYPDASVYQVMQSIIDSASKDKLTDLDSDSPNTLLYSEPSLSEVYWQDSTVTIPTISNLVIEDNLPPSTCKNGDSHVMVLGYNYNGWAYWPTIKIYSCI